MTDPTRAEIEGILELHDRERQLASSQQAVMAATTKATDQLVALVERREREAMRKQAESTLSIFHVYMDDRTVKGKSWPKNVKALDVLEILEIQERQLTAKEGQDGV